ncbi:hypothetical protein [Psychrobium sp. 1_MG-2023]|uniref:hypothetical protein n=1 Tax=Psychrobium sp. 1_MG-2023 TaxID=3062624 RepID=UPI000C3285EA|nr:hypothetical protein [Psychrobium sp. 1_MG-2023]MDP2561010.1 hypothetical protein [Psychrobium sp. 1_MG-2023]PKF58304.1 hypothetical protein CW748_03855 [Alteromonadales bacterium alter-6D02]
MHRLIVNQERYLAIAWLCSLFNVTALCIVPFMFHILIMPDIGNQPITTLVDIIPDSSTVAFLIHFIIVFLSSFTFLLLNPWLKSTNFKFGFYLGLTPVCVTAGISAIILIIIVCLMGGGLYDSLVGIG